MQRFRFPILVFLALTAFAAATSGQASAQVFRRDPSLEPESLDIDGRAYKPYGQARLWLFRFHPFASLGASYDYNVFLAPPYQRKDDFVFDAVAGLRTDVRFGRSETLLGYQAKARAFLNHPSENLVEHRLSLLSQWNFNHWMFVDVGSEYSHRKDPMPDEVDLVTDRDSNDAFLRAGIFEERFGAELEYRFDWVDFVDPAFRSLDHTEHRISLSGYYMLREDSTLAQKVYAFLEVSTGAFRFRERRFSDSNFASVSVGAKGMLYDRFGFVFKVGYSGIDPKGNGSLDDTERFRGPMYEATVMWSPVQEGQFRLSSYRRIQYDTNSNYRIFDRLEGSYGHTFWEKVYVRPSVFLDHADPSNSRSLTRIGCGITAEYFFKGWLAASIGWEYAMRTARRLQGSPSLDYRDHQIHLTVTALF